MTIRELIEELQDIARRSGDHLFVEVDGGSRAVEEVAYQGGGVVEIRT